MKMEMLFQVFAGCEPDSMAQHKQDSRLRTDPVQRNGVCALHLGKRLLSPALLF